MAVISDEICIKAMSDAEKFVKFIDDLHIESNDSPDIDVLQSKNFNDPSMN